jgi:hypothetical protein
MGRASLPDDLKARILSATKQEPSPTRRAAGTADVIVLAATLAAVLNLFLACGGVLAGENLERSYVSSAAWATVAGAATWVAFARGKSMLGRRKSALAAASAGTIVAGVGVVRLSSSWAGASGSVVRALLMGTLASTIILAGFVYSRRGSGLRHPRAAGAALGAASAAWAALLVELNQPQLQFGSALLAHLIPMLLAIALGYALGGRVIVRRYVVARD